MNAALRKESRLLLPAWILALVAATLPVWVLGSDVQSMGQMSFILFAAGALFLSLSSFGLEMSFGTFPALLAQPRPRLDIWQMKIGLLSVALAVVVVASSFSCWLQIQSIPTRGTVWPDFVKGILLMAVIAFAGGLWTTLLFRQMVTAFWLAILVPLVLYNASLPLIERLLGEDDASFFMAVLSLAACAYAMVGYGLARWLFLHAQDKQAPEATDSAVWSLLPEFPTPRWPVAALVIKEVRLQQGTLLIGVGLILLHLAAEAVSQYYPPLATKLSFLREIWMVWMVAPLVVGCASFAEERRGQTLQSTLCLPFAPSLQFVVKLLVVFGLGLFLGTVMPWSLEQLRSAPGLDNSAIPALFIAAATITAIGFYASSLSGTLLQAIGAALGLLLMSTVVLASLPLLILACNSGFRSFSWPVLIATYLFLSYANFKELRITWRQCLRNGLISVAVVLMLCAILGAFLFYVKADVPLKPIWLT
jgi:hypothetical protein